MFNIFKRQPKQVEQEQRKEIVSIDTAKDLFERVGVDFYSLNLPHARDNHYHKCFQGLNLKISAYSGTAKVTGEYVVYEPGKKTSVVPINLEGCLVR